MTDTCRMLALIKKKNQNPTLCRISKIDMSFSTKSEILGRRTRAECNVNGKEKKVGNRWGEKQEQDKQLSQFFWPP